ncbi:MAG: tetratricopeptide repeat protein [Proteobacteria bacterium]|nr:tetratricopeptide repeat protein [Pseudomonadota bacterium]
MPAKGDKEKDPKPIAEESDTFQKRFKNLHQAEENLIEEKLKALTGEIQKLAAGLATEKGLLVKVEGELAENVRALAVETTKRKEKEKKLEEETAARKGKEKELEEETRRRKETEKKLEEETTRRKEKETFAQDEILKRKGREKELEEEISERQKKEKAAQEWETKSREKEERIAELEESFAYERGIMTGDINELKKNLAQVEKDKAELDKESRDFRRKEEEWENERKLIREELERQTQKNRDLGQRFDQLREKTIQAIDKLKESQSQKEESWNREREALAKRFEDGEVRNKLLRAEMAELQDRIREQEEEKENLSQLVQRSLISKQGLEEELKKTARSSGLEVGDDEALVEKIGSTLDKLKNQEAQTAKFKEENLGLQKQVDDIEFELRKSSDYGISLIAEKEALIEEIGVLQEGFDRKQKDLERELEVVIVERETRVQEVTHLKESVARAETELDEFKTRLAAAEEEKKLVQKKLDAAWETQKDVREKLEAQPKAEDAEELLTKAQDHFKKGKQFFGKQQYAKALAAFEEALKLEPTRSEYYTGIGLVHSLEFSRHKPDIPKAESCFLQAIKLEPKNARNYYYLGVIYKSQEQSEKAKSYFRKALEYQPDYPEVQEQIKLLKSEKG